MVSRVVEPLSCRPSKQSPIVGMVFARHFVIDVGGLYNPGESGRRKSGLAKIALKLFSCTGLTR